VYVLREDLWKRDQLQYTRVNDNVAIGVGMSELLWIKKYIIFLLTTWSKENGYEIWHMKCKESV
jgi:hypothetical protein